LVCCQVLFESDSGTTRDMMAPLSSDEL
jgi:hypothetical protein